MGCMQNLEEGSVDDPECILITLGHCTIGILLYLWMKLKGAEQSVSGTVYITCWHYYYMRLIILLCPYNVLFTFLKMSWKWRR